MLSSSRQLAFANHERYNFQYIVFEPGLTFRFENVQSKFSCGTFLTDDFIIQIDTLQLMS